MPSPPKPRSRRVEAPGGFGLGALAFDMAGRISREGGGLREVTWSWSWTGVSDRTPELDA
jgi:hypothetical protein